jgi:hypothetical protein
MELNEHAITLLGEATVALNATGQTTLYTVPTGKRGILTHAVIVAGADAGASVVTIGQVGALTDWLAANTLDNLDAQYDAVILQPVPNTTPLKGKSYAAGTVIQIDVTTALGGASNAIYLFGFLY